MKKYVLPASVFMVFSSIYAMQTPQKEKKVTALLILQNNIQKSSEQLKTLEAELTQAKQPYQKYVCDNKILVSNTKTGKELLDLFYLEEFYISKKIAHFCDCVSYWKLQVLKNNNEKSYNDMQIKQQKAQQELDTYRKETSRYLKKVRDDQEELSKMLQSITEF